MAQKVYDSPVKPFMDDLENMFKFYDNLGRDRRANAKAWGPPASEDPRLAFQVLVDNIAPGNRSKETYWYARLQHWYTVNDHRPVENKDGSRIIRALPHLFTNAARDGLEAIEYVEMEKDGKLKFFTRSFRADKPNAPTSAPAQYSRGGEAGGYLTLDQCDQRIKLAQSWGERRPVDAMAAVLRPAYRDKNALPRLSKLLEAPLGTPAALKLSA